MDFLRAAHAPQIVVALYASEETTHKQLNKLFIFRDGKNQYGFVTYNRNTYKSIITDETIHVFMDNRQSAS
jgi:hypothetical protein